MFIYFFIIIIILVFILLMQVKNFQQIPFEQVFKMAQEKYQSLDYEEAEYLYSIAFKQRPHDQILILCYSNILKLNQKQQQAKHILQQSIKSNPFATYKRYFELAQLYNGIASIQAFEKGIENAIQSLANPFKSTTPQKEIRRDIAQAYAGMAQVCMTDLLQQKQAEPKCRESLEKGFNMDKSCIDIRLQKANYLMWKDEFDSAKLQLLQIYKWIMQQKEQYESQIMNTAAKYLIQVEQYKKSFQIFEKLHEDSSSQLEILYMLAFCCFKLEDYSRCEDYVEQYDQRYKQKKKNKEILDEQIEEAMNEMKVQMSKKKKDYNQTGEGQDEEWMDVQQQDEDEMQN